MYRRHFGAAPPANGTKPHPLPAFAFFFQRVDFISDIFRAQTLRPDVIAAEADLVRVILAQEDFLSHVQK